MSESFRTIATAMDPASSGQAVSMRTLLQWHRWKNGVTPSLREVLRRHTKGAAIRFLSYNTYLTEAHFTIPIPIPGVSDIDVELHAKPALHERASEIGALASEYDVAALYEVMQEEQKGEILRAWRGAPPCQFAYGGVLSSLFTISKRFPIPRSELHPFAIRGKKFEINPVVGPRFNISLDSDFYAHKGVLMVELATGFGNIEVYSTHLMFGGGLGSAAEDIVNLVTPFGDHVSPSNAEERFAIELAQLDELIQFYRETHKNPKNIGLICGDFNIDGSDPGKFAQIKNRMAAISMRDAWVDGPYSDRLPKDSHRNVLGGQTARNDDGDGVREPDFSHVCVPLANAGGDIVCDDSKAMASTSEFVGRFDYLFVEEPQKDHGCTLDFARVRRRAFPRGSITDGQGFLSDHLGLDTTLFVCPTT